MADAASLIDGKGTVKKNIHIFIIGLVSIVVVVAIFMQDASSKKRKADKAKEPVKQSEQVVVKDNIKGVLDKQKAEVPDPNPPVVGIPGVVTDGVGKDAKETAVLNDKEIQAVETARSEAQQAGSAILAISSDSLSLGNIPPAFQQQPTQNEADYKINRDDMRQALAGPLLEAQQPQAPKVLTKQEQDEAFLEKQSKRAKTTAIVEDIANSPYTIFEGSVIPAVLMTQVNSQLPGQITGLVSQDVYDDVTGSHLIIPKGSTVFGTYSNNVVQGQSRLIVTFSRLKLPNGRTVSLLGMPGADKIGQHGIEGDVNNRYFQRYGFSFLTAVLGGIADRQSSGSTTVINTGNGGNGVSTAAGTILTQIAQNEQNRASQIQPIVVLKQGEKFNINVNRDIAIAPYM